MAEVKEAMSGLLIAVAGIVTVGLMSLAILFINLIK